MAKSAAETTPPSLFDDGRLLNGIRILDFTRILAGPYCTALLADLGAEVIKVEPPQGDDYRHIGPFLADHSSALFESVNRGKRGIVLDLARPEHREAAIALARTSDVVVENFRPGVADKLGIGWRTLSAVNPRLVYASISGFGQGGPNSSRPAYDFILQAMSGIMATTGDPSGPPMPVGESIADLAAGLFASWAVLAALVDRERNDRGRHIDLGMFDAMIALQPTTIARYLATGDVPKRVGSRHALSAPFGSFHARDGEVVIAVLNEKLFTELAGCMGRADLLNDPRFASDALRLTHEMELRCEIETWLADFSAPEAVDRLIAAGVPTSCVATIEDALQSAQVAARPVLQSVPHPGLGPLMVPEQPARFLDAPRGQSAAAPRLGEHTAEILGALAAANAEARRAG
jgi:CoA:oxalate CoA-transferase